MHNMNVENECKDAKENYDTERASGKVTQTLMEGHDGMGGLACNIGTLGDLLRNDTCLYGDSSKEEDLIDHVVATERKTCRQQHVEEVITRIDKGGLFDLMSSENLHPACPIAGTASKVSLNDLVVLQAQSLLMKHIASDKRPRSSLDDSDDDLEQEAPRYQKCQTVAPNASLAQLEPDIEFTDIQPRDQY